MTKAERKKLCGLMDVKKLSVDASMHAAQNERLPLRVVVQVLFFEQVRAAASVQALGNKNSLKPSYTMSMDKECDKMVNEKCHSLKNQMCDLKIKEEEFFKNGKLNKNNSKSSKSGMQLLPSRSRRIFDKLWIGGGSKGQGESRSSETSGSSNSPTSIVPGYNKSFGISSRNGRHSVS